VTGAVKTDTKTQRNYGTGKDADNNGSFISVLGKSFFQGDILSIDRVPFNG
jgi:hypothetical protein